MIEHWEHLRCAGIRLVQYKETWVCHQHRESRLTTHTDITPPYPPRPWLQPPTLSPPTPLTPPQPKHRHISDYPIFPMFLQNWKSPNPILSPTHPQHLPPRPEPNTYTCHPLHLHLSPHSSLARHLH